MKAQSQPELCVIPFPSSTNTTTCSRGGLLGQLCHNSTSLVTATDLTRLRAVTADSAARLGKA